MSIIDTIRRLARRRALADLHPELANRQAVFSEASDEVSALLGRYSAGQSYAGIAWVYKAVSTVAQVVAAQRLRIVAADGSELDTHPMAAVLGNPNPSASAADLWRAWAIDMQLQGESGIEAVYAGTRLVEIWRRDPAHVDIVVDPARRRYGGVNGYRIHDGNGPDYLLPPREFAHSKYLDPRQPWRGLAPIEAIRNSLLIDQYAQAWSIGFFENAARPDFAIVTKQGLTATEREKLGEQFRKRFGGVGKAHLPLIAEEGVTDIKILAFPPKDMEWLAQRQSAREEIGAIFGVPDEIMGWGRDTYENYGQSLRVFWQLTLLPILQLRDDSMTRWARGAGLLAPTEAVDTDLSGVEALQEDRGAKVEQAQRLWGMGVPLNTVNQVLALGLGDVPGGDIAYLPMGLAPVGAPSAAPAQLGASAAPVTVAMITRAADDKPGVDLSYGGPLHRALWALFRDAVEDETTKMTRHLKRELQAQQDRVSAAVRQGGTTVGDVFDREEERDLFERSFKPDITGIVDAGGKEAVRQLGGAIVWDITDPNVIEMIGRLAWRFADEITDTTYKALAALLSTGASEGWTIVDTAEALANLYDGFKGYRAELIARTESTKGYNAGSLEGYKQADAEERVWLATLDDRVRPDHEEMHGVHAKIGEPFTVGGYEMMFPGDPNAPPEQVCNCRCAMYGVPKP